MAVDILVTLCFSQDILRKVKFLMLEFLCHNHILQFMTSNFIDSLCMEEFEQVNIHTKILFILTWPSSEPIERNPVQYRMNLIRKNLL